MATTLVGVTTLVFLIMRATPGDPARLMLGDFATPEALAQLRAQLGLDRPLGEAYFEFLQDYARGDLGTSLSSRRPVIDEIAARAPTARVFEPTADTAPTFAKAYSEFVRLAKAQRQMYRRLNGLSL